MEGDDWYEWGEFMGTERNPICSECRKHPVVDMTHSPLCELCYGEKYETWEWEEFIGSLDNGDMLDFGDKK